MLIAAPERSYHKSGHTLTGMWVCVRCRSEFPEFTGGAEANLDAFGLHFMCPVCGRRNHLRSLGLDEEGCLCLEQIDEPE